MPARGVRLQAGDMGCQTLAGRDVLCCGGDRKKMPSEDGLSSSPDSHPAGIGSHPKPYWRRDTGRADLVPDIDFQLNRLEVPSLKGFPVAANDADKAPLGVSERRACRVLGQARSTHRHRGRTADDKPRLVARIIELATQYGRYGYRRITGLLRGEGWPVNHKRVERLWRREGLKVPQKQPKRGRLWLTDGSGIRRRPAYRDSMDHGFGSAAG